MMMMMMIATDASEDRLQVKKSENLGVYFKLKSENSQVNWKTSQTDTCNSSILRKYFKRPRSEGNNMNQRRKIKLESKLTRYVILIYCESNWTHTFCCYIILAIPKV